MFGIFQGTHNRLSFEHCWLKEKLCSQIRSDLGEILQADPLNHLCIEQGAWSPAPSLALPKQIAEFLTWSPLTLQENLRVKFKESINLKIKNFYFLFQQPQAEI